jgi:hypothetical protein
MVTTGYSQNTEIIDLVDATNVCTGLASYPHLTASVSAGLYNESTPLLCGGWTKNGYLDGCYTISATKVEQIATLSKPRVGAASVFINETTFWLTGGHIQPNNVLQESSEFIQLGGETTSVKDGQDLPLKLALHCMLLLNDTTIIVIGGMTVNWTPVDITYYLDIQQIDAQWVQGPSLQEKKHSQACGIFTSNFHNNQRTLVVTGGNPSTISTEFLVLGSESKWTKGKIHMNNQFTQTLEGYTGCPVNIRTDSFEYNFFCDRTISKNLILK